MAMIWIDISPQKLTNVIGYNLILTRSVKIQIYGFM